MNKLKSFFDKKNFKFFFYKAIGFALLWIANGFSLGTLTLLGPVRWLTTWARKNNWGQQKEDLLINLIILIFVIISFLISLWIMKRITKSSSSLLKILIYIICYCFAGVALFLLANPEILNAGNDIESSVGESQFTLGAYPTEEELVKLKDKGFTTIICLLHPAIVPLEPILIEKEKKAVEDIGMEFINIPMLPWISDNEDAILKIKSLTKKKNEKYYMHCYLGKDRVNVMRRIILKENIKIKETAPKSNRTLDDIASFERGKIYVLRKSSIYFTPFPTDEEFFSFIVGGDIKEVVSLLNPDNHEDLILINKEKDILKKYKITFKLLTVTDKTSDTKIKEYINLANSLPKPLLIHNVKTDDPVSQNFINLYNKQNKVKN